MHLIVTRDDLGTFAHLHPEPTGEDGVFAVDGDLPDRRHLRAAHRVPPAGPDGRRARQPRGHRRRRRAGPVPVPAEDVREPGRRRRPHPLDGDAHVGETSDLTLVHRRGDRAAGRRPAALPRRRRPRRGHARRRLAVRAPARGDLRRPGPAGARAAGHRVRPRARPARRASTARAPTGCGRSSGWATAPSSPRRSWCTPTECCPAIPSRPLSSAADSARADPELGEHVAQVEVDRPRAEEQLGGHVPVRTARAATSRATWSSCGVSWSGARRAAGRSRRRPAAPGGPGRPTARRRGPRTSPGPRAGARGPRPAGGVDAGTRRTPAGCARPSRGRSARAWWRERGLEAAPSGAHRRPAARRPYAAAARACGVSTAAANPSSLAATRPGPGRGGRRPTAPQSRPHPARRTVAGVTICSRWCTASAYRPATSSRSPKAQRRASDTRTPRTPTRCAASHLVELGHAARRTCRRRAPRRTAPARPAASPSGRAARSSAASCRASVAWEMAVVDPARAEGERAPGARARTAPRRTPRPRGRAPAASRTCARTPRRRRGGTPRCRARCRGRCPRRPGTASNAARNGVAAAARRPPSSSWKPTSRAARQRWRSVSPGPAVTGISAGSRSVRSAGGANVEAAEARTAISSARAGSVPATSRAARVHNRTAEGTEWRRNSTRPRSRSRSAARSGSVVRRRPLGGQRSPRVRARPPARRSTPPPAVAGPARRPSTVSPAARSNAALAAS